MNKRINELAFEANKDLDGNVPIGFAEKFAELIVQECMAIAKNWENQLESSELLEESNAVGIVAYRIARQFGVKQ